MDLADDITGRLRVWAASHDAVEALWLFGSRARGDARLESDVDLALELTSKSGDTDWAFGTYISCAVQWKDKLTSITGCPVSMVPFRDDLPGRFDPRVAGIELWRRNLHTARR
jgi:predicted nucleotidyltransferase